MATEEYYFSVLSRAAAMLQPIEMGIRSAGGDPRVEMPRLINQAGLGAAVGRMMMDGLFESIYCLPFTPNPSRSFEDYVVLRWAQHSTRRLHATAQDQVWKDFLQVLPAGEPGEARYHLLEARREISPKEAGALLPHKYGVTVPLELLQVAECLPPLEEAISIAGGPWTQAQSEGGFTAAVSIAKRKITLLRPADVLEAGSLFLVKERSF